jgi:surface polysaccharide O-acyltransferase-like enzyme
MSEGSPRRLPGLDALKGGAIVLVVLIHATPDGAIAYRNDFVQGIPRLAVPLFLVVTGYLAGFRNLPRERLATYFRRMLALHLFYGAFYWGVSLLAEGVPETTTLKSALLHFWAGSYMGQFYLVVLVQVFFVAAYALPERAWRSGTAVVVSALAAVAGIALLTGQLPGGGGALGELLARVRQNGVWLWFYYFSLGGYLGARRRAAEARGESSGTRGAAALAAAAAIGVALVTPLETAAPTGLSYVRYPLWVGATLLALAVPGLARWDVLPGLQRLGRETFALYVLNPAILLLLYALVGRPQAAWSSWLYAAATVAVGFAAGRLMRRRTPFLLP